MTFRIRFAKYGVVKFIGHLDVMRYFQKVVRRSELPVKYSQGFNPHQLMTFAQPLSVGVTSDGEYFEIEFEDEKLMAEVGVTPAGSKDIGNGIVVPVPAKQDIPALEKTVLSRLAAETFEGFEILAVRLLPPPEPNKKTENAMAIVSAADYCISVKDGYESQTGADSGCFAEELLSFISKESIPIVKKTKKNEKEIDLKPYIYAGGKEPDMREYVPGGANRGSAQCPVVCEDSRINQTGLEHADEYDNKQRVFLRLAAGSVINIKPELVIEAFLASKNAEFNPNAFQMHRMQMYRGDRKLKGLI